MSLFHLVLFLAHINSAQLLPLTIVGGNSVAGRFVESSAIERLSRQRWHIRQYESGVVLVARRSITPIIRVFWNPVHVTIDSKFSGRRITKDQLGQLRSIRDLRGLVFYGTDLDDVLMKDVAALKSVRILSVIGSRKLTDKSIEQIAQMPLIKVLSLSGQGITNAAMVRLVQMQHLVDINLSYTKVDDRGVATLSQKRDWDFISTRGCNITDAAVKSLSRCKLRALVLSDCPMVTNASVVYFRKMSNLRFLSLEGTSVSAKLAKGLQQDRPKMTVAY